MTCLVAAGNDHPPRDGPPIPPRPRQRGIARQGPADDGAVAELREVPVAVAGRRVPLYNRAFAERQIEAL